MAVYDKKRRKNGLVFEESIETTPVGKLADIKNMDEPTLKFWAEWC